MRRLLDKAKRTKKKTGEVLDRLKLPSGQSRSTSPAPSHQIRQRIENEQDEAPESSAAADVPPAHSPIPPRSAAPTPLPTDSMIVPPEEAPASALLFPDLAPELGKVSPPPTTFSVADAAIKNLAGQQDASLFPSLNIALSAIMNFANSWNGTQEARDELHALQSKLKAFDALANTPMSNAPDPSDNFQKHLRFISDVVQRLWRAVGNAAGDDRSSQSTQPMQDIGEFKALLEILASSLKHFEVDDAVAVEDRFAIVRQRISSQYRPAVESPQLPGIANYTGNVTYNVGGAVNINNSTNNYVLGGAILPQVSDLANKQEKCMKKIKSILGENFVSEAADDEQPSYTGCMAGTRTTVLSKFMEWIENDPMAIFWLAGMAGTGKTSIAVSLCRMLRNDPGVLFGGGYFCSRSAGSIARTDVRRILPTLAALLAGHSQKFAEALRAELEKDQRVGHKPIGEQIGPFLRIPLAALASLPLPIVFVIDALDECSSEREVTELLRLLADFDCGTKVKFILTSRPEMHIRGTPISSRDHSTILQLHTISPEEVKSDVRLYIGKQLESTEAQSSWYTDLDVELLVNLSGGLFIFASTVLLYVLDPDDDEERQNRLRKATTTVANRNTATAAVDKIYELVLTGALQDGTVDDDELETMKHIVASILTTRVSLSVIALADLMRIKPGRLRSSLRRLHSLVHIPSDDAEPGVRTLHASLGDYLFHRAPEHVRIAPTLGHYILASGCMMRMARDDLCFNVSRSRSSFEPNSQTVLDCIPLALVYACLHWAYHITSASNRSAFDREIGGVFRTKFLFWLEVLSILGKTHFASGLLRIAGSGGNEPIVSQFLRDANAFVASSHGAISRSAPHIYLSALPFAAKDSLVYHDFVPLCTGIVSVTTVGIDRHGGGLVATLTGHEKAVNSVTYSPDSRLLASGSDDGTVRIWNTRTGEETMSPLRSDDGGVNSVAFSPNGQCVASGTDNGLVHVWSVSTGRPALKPLRGHSGMVSSVAFHPNGTLIASASSDKTVRLWSVETGLGVYVMNGHTDRVNAIAFSHDGRLLASGSSDKTIRLWNPHTGEAVGDSINNLEGAAISLSFSPDGKWLAAGLEETSIARIWDLSTQQLASAVSNIHSLNSSAVFSPDGLVIASSDYLTIRSWDSQSGRELARVPFSGHSDSITSVAFSPDGQFLASGSGDCTVRIWDAVGGLESAVQPLEGHNSLVTSVAASPNGTLIVSGSFDRSIRIWDENTGREQFRPLLGHSDVVMEVAISPDGCLIASASQDRTIMVWAVHTGELVDEPLRGHEEGVIAVAFSPDSRWLASGSEDRTVRIWEVATWKETAFSPLECTAAVRSVVFSPDGQLLAAIDTRGLVHFWRSRTNQPACVPFEEHSGGVNCIAFSPDSQRVAYGADGTKVRVWSIADESQVLVLDGHTDEVYSVAYSPDGRYIVSASTDTTVRLWNAHTGDAVVQLFGHEGPIASVVFTPDGRSIVSGGFDATIHIWDVEAALLLRSHTEQNCIAKLACSPLEKDGWLVGSSGELLLWVPEQYRGHIQLPPCSMLISSHKVFLAVKGPENELHWGDKWTACWHNGAHPAVSPAPF